MLRLAKIIDKHNDLGFDINTSSIVTKHSGETPMLDRILWTIMVVPFLTLIVLMLYARLQPCLGTLSKYGGLRAQAIIVMEFLVRNDDDPLKWDFKRVLGFLAFVTLGGMWITHFWPAGPEADMPTDQLFRICLVIIGAYSLWIAVSAAKVWSNCNPYHEGLELFIQRLRRKLFKPRPIDEDSLPAELWLVTLMLGPTLLLFIGEPDPANTPVVRALKQSGVNYYAQVREDPSKIFDVDLAMLTPTLCSSAMRQTGTAFAEEGVKNAKHAQHYARCVVLTQIPIPKKE